MSETTEFNLTLDPFGDKAAAEAVAEAADAAAAQKPEAESIEKLAMSQLS